MSNCSEFRFGSDFHAAIKVIVIIVVKKASIAPAAMETARKTKKQVALVLNEIVQHTRARSQLVSVA